MLIRAPTIRRKRNAAASRNRSSQIFMDKIVDGRREPTLFNVESARLTAEFATGPYQSVSQMRKPKALSKNRRDINAKETLAKLNITVSEHSEDYSLLEENSEKQTIANYRIMDSLDFVNTVNKEINVQDKFPYDNDPFYQLDDALRSPRIYKIPTTKNGAIKRDPDLSFILANLNILNRNKSYHGKSKYF